MPIRVTATVLFLCSSLLAQDSQNQHPQRIDPAEFRSVVRNTEPLTPAEELKQFHLPPGFEIQLVAAEPQIAKPMNMAFDARGRLWVTSSEEYPFPAPSDRKARDTVSVLEIDEKTGRADRVTTFADGLNIPMGLYPYRDGVVVMSIPHIWFLRDTDGDGSADKRERLYGPIGYEKDTHGMCNAFRRGYDGWLYACHGFNNTTSLAGRDGHAILMQSGNTFRMRLDGSRVEHYSHGLVNPFGMTFDPNGDLFVADCHTKPISLILEGGYYDSFGKPHDGLGYVPNVMDHLHGSTAIGGIAIYNASQFPAEYRGNSFGGNVMTSRINRNVLNFSGSTVQAVEQPDFLSCDDPWFRPADLLVGPDGALYITDFYNRIIGHYEIKLDDPRRDRRRGRIWRIVYTGTKTPSPVLPDLTTLPVEQLVLILGSDNLTHRNLAGDRLVDHFGSAAIGPVRRGLTDSDRNMRIHSLWVLHRLNAVHSADLATAVHDRDWQVRVHAQRVIGARQESAPEFAQWIQAGLSDEQQLVRRAAAMAATRHQSASLLHPLLQLFHATGADDVHLRHAVRMAIRDHLRDPERFAEISSNVERRDVELLSGICLSLNSQPAADFVVQHIERLAQTRAGDVTTYIKFAAGLASPETLESLAKTVRQNYADQPDFQFELLTSVRDGLTGRQISQPPAVREWALALATRLLSAEANVRPIGWDYVSHPGHPDQGNSWVVSRRRNSADGQKQTPLFSSFPLGEKRTGIYRSSPFELRVPFRFYMAGHDGYPDKPAQKQNLVRLRDAKSNETLALWYPPRNDTARQFSLGQKELTGRRVVVELVDGDANGAYAWLAVGRFSDPWLNPSPLVEKRRRAAELTSAFLLRELRQPLASLLESPMDRESEAAVLRAVISVDGAGRSLPLALIPGIQGASSDLRAAVRLAVMLRDADVVASLLGSAMQVATAAEQLRLAQGIGVDAAGARTLLTLVESGKAAARLLKDPQVAQQLIYIRDESIQKRIAAAVAGLPDEDKRIADLIAERQTFVANSPGVLEAGRELFRKTCAVCHQVAGQGKKVGPNLDGIGGRGLARLVEDTLAPNRNVDVAFRTTTLVTDTGKVYNGLIKSREGAVLVLVDSNGKELTVSKDSVDQQIATRLSPMPANIAERLTEDQFRDLVTYLLSLR